MANTGTNTVTILPSAAGNTVANQGTLSYDANGDLTNEATATTDDPAAAGTGNPATFPVAGGPAPEVPTLDTLGLMVLAVTLALLALALMKRRQKELQ